MVGLLRLLRPRQWIKNGFVFVGFLFASHWNLGVFLQVIIGFCAFCCASSAVYIFNDICDLEADKAHHIKRDRPLASGQVAQFDADLLLVFMVAAAIAAGFDLGPMGVAVIGAYLVINYAYSVYLKYIPILDAFVIAAGFMLRILMGSAVVGLPVGHWLLLTGLMLTLFLAFCKRRIEGRYECHNYVLITAACTIMAYALYTMAPETVAYHNTHALLYTTPFVIYGILRYLMLAGDDASVHLTTDPHLIVAGTGWLALTLLICWS